MTATKRGPGRPKKSAIPPPEAGEGVARAAAKVSGEEKPAPKSSAERQRDWRERKKGKAEPAPTADLSVTDGDVAAAGELGAVVWDIVGPFARLRPLNDSQKERLGAALAPLVKKYMPLLADWQYEVGAAMCIFALARETAIPKEAPTEEVPDDRRVEAAAGA